MRRLSWAWVLLPAVAACTQPDLDGTRWRCAVDGDCGAGWVCQVDKGASAGVCVLAGALTDTGGGDIGDVGADTADGVVDAADSLDGGFDALDGGVDALDGGLDALDGGVDTADGGVPDGGADADATSPDLCDTSCDDGNPCTTDGCDPVTGCTHTPSPGPCDDGDPCTPEDSCSDGQCQPGGAMDCDDGDPCTSDSCDPGSGCVHGDADGTGCDDGEPCTSNDSCQGGVCQGGTFICDCATDGDCKDDGNLCNGTLVCDQASNTCKVDLGTVISCDTTTDPPCKKSECVPETGACVLVALPNGTGCTDSNLCTAGDECASGACVGGTVDCADSEPCTADSCAPATGCVHAPNTSPCTDGNACTVGDVCAGGVCKPGAPAGCDDGEACTSDSCSPATGCAHAPLGNGTPCGAGKECSGGKCESLCGPYEQYDAIVGACVAATAEIPAGSFWMGCKPGTNEPCQEDEKPYHEVVLGAFAVDLTEVTASQYESCVADGACPPIQDSDCNGGGSTNFGKPTRDAHPINCVVWQRAAAYCTWAGKSLCTEAQWEKAAKGGCETVTSGSCAASLPRFPWGDVEPVCGQHAVFNDSGAACGTGATYAVGEGSKAQGTSPYGAYDMGGNVWEWCADWYAGDYYCKGPAAICQGVCNDCAGQLPYQTPWSNPTGPPSLGPGTQRVIRGSGYQQGAASLRVGNRGLKPVTEASVDVGFRCCSAGQ